MFSGMRKGNSKQGEPAAGEIELFIDEGYIADKGHMVARIDKASMRQLRISAGDAIIIFSEERPVIAKALALYPSDGSTQTIRLGASIRAQIGREVGDGVSVRGIGNTKIDKVVNYLLFEELGKQGRQ